MCQHLGEKNFLAHEESCSWFGGLTILSVAKRIAAACLDTLNCSARTDVSSSLDSGALPAKEFIFSFSAIAAAEKISFGMSIAAIQRFA
jgi:hypothetical protein